jgi:hypothetical protein
MGPAGNCRAFCLRGRRRGQEVRWPDLSQKSGEACAMVKCIYLLTKRDQREKCSDDKQLFFGCAVEIGKVVASLGYRNVK